MTHSVAYPGGRRVRSYQVATVKRVKGARKTLAGTAEPAAPIFSPTIVRRFVDAGMCPWCNAGPFVVLATHVHRAHAIDKLQLRELAGLFYSSSICAPEHADRCASRAKRLMEGGKDLRPRRDGPRRLSPAAKALNAEKFDRARALAPPGRPPADLGREAHIAARAAERQKDPRVCMYCGIVFVLERRRGKASRRTCSNDCLTALRADRIRTLNSTLLPWSITCKVCGIVKEGLGNRPKRVTCSRECRNALLSQQKMTLPRPCLTCGKPLEGKKNGRATCSPECSHAARVRAGQQSAKARGQR